MFGIFGSPVTEIFPEGSSRELFWQEHYVPSKVILLDEPVTGLDPKVTAEFYQVTKDLNEEGIAVIMVSHDVQALTYATHILHMDQRDSFYGTKEEYMNSDKWKLFKNTEEDRIGGEKK